MHRICSSAQDLSFANLCMKPRTLTDRRCHAQLGSRPRPSIVATRRGVRVRAKTNCTGQPTQEVVGTMLLCPRVPPSVVGRSLHKSHSWETTNAFPGGEDQVEVIVTYHLTPKLSADKRLQQWNRVLATGCVLAPRSAGDIRLHARGDKQTWRNQSMHFNTIKTSLQDQVRALPRGHS